MEVGSACGKYFKRTFPHFFPEMYCQFTLIKALRGLKICKDFGLQPENAIKRTMQIQQYFSKGESYERERERERDRDRERETDRQQTERERECVRKERELNLPPCCFSFTGLWRLLRHNMF